MNTFKMNKRRTELSKLSSYIQKMDTEVTMILQSLQWDRKHLIEGCPMTPCQYDRNHTVPPDRLHVHERECRVRGAGYLADEQLLPDPLDVHAGTLVTLNKEDITNIIDYAAKVDPVFQKGRGPDECQPLSLGRLQEAYSMDERRAIQDAVVNAVPSCHQLHELALPHGEGSQSAAQGKSRAAVLAELRDMRRRRTKYRGAAKTRNYSDVLRDLISTQMEYYSEAQSVVGVARQLENLNTNETNRPKEYEKVRIKEEPVEDKPKEPRSRQSDRSKDRHKKGERDRRHADYERAKHRDERDRYSDSLKGSSKDRSDYRSRDKYRKEESGDSNRNDYRSRDKYRKDGSGDLSRNDYRGRDKYRKDEGGDSSHSRTREYKDSSKSWRYSDSRDKQERGDRYSSNERSHKHDRYKRYYDCKQEDFEFHSQHIKREKD